MEPSQVLCCFLCMYLRGKRHSLEKRSKMEVKVVSVGGDEEEMETSHEYLRRWWQYDLKINRQCLITPMVFVQLEQTQVLWYEI